MKQHHWLSALATLLGLVLSQPVSSAETNSPGVTDTEIKIGQTMPYSGPASIYGTIGKAEAAYFRMINDQGGINGRKVRLISLDDGYTPPKTVEQTRKLVEGEEVMLVFSMFGTATSAAVQRYLNQRGVPQLFPVSGATRWGDPERFPWTMGFQPTLQTEGRIIAQYLLEHRPGTKIGVLYQNDDFGKDYLKGVGEPRLRLQMTPRRTKLPDSNCCGHGCTDRKRAMSPFDGRIGGSCVSRVPEQCPIWRLRPGSPVRYLARAIGRVAAGGPSAHTSHAAYRSGRGAE
jgi:hypothetical protein